MPSKYIRNIIWNRDLGVCWHCGSEETTIHHRRNRGAGGDRTKSKVADRPSNLLTICPEYNFLMESDLNVIREAREKGWKLQMGQNPSLTPVYRFDGTWWWLTDLGKVFRVTEGGKDE